MILFVPNPVTMPRIILDLIPLRRRNEIKNVGMFLSFWSSVRRLVLFVLLFGVADSAEADAITDFIDGHHSAKER